MTETMNTFATLTNLDADKLYFIHVGSMLKSYGLGMDDIAPVATATVRTWSLTPSAPVLEYGGHTASSVVVQWRFDNSTLEVVQVSRNNETWLDCIDANHCLSSTRRPVEERQLYIEGLLTLSKLEPGSSYVLYVRGCTKQGCGPSTSIAAQTILQVPAAPSIGLLGSSVNTAALNWTFDDTETVLVQVSQNHTTWLNCTDEKDNCKISSLYNWSASHWSGIVTLINLHSGTFYTASVRGCNYYGCGAHNSTDFSTAKAARFPLRAVAMVSTSDAWDSLDFLVLDESMSYVHPKEVSMWEDNMKSWPPIEKPDIVFYLVHSKACDLQEVRAYKSLESYLYLTSGLVGTVLHHRISDQLGYFKAEVGRSQSFNAAPHKAWACVHTTGRVVTGGCSCMAGQAKVCSHVGAILWKMEHAFVNKMTGTACTDEAAAWNREIKCPNVLNCEDLLNSGKYDIKKNGNGIFELQPKGRNKFYYQVQFAMHCTGKTVCHLYVWSEGHDEVVVVPYNKDFMKCYLQRVKNFYFKSLLPAFVEDVNSGKITLSNEYKQLARM
ncbi:uncharacterized protein LOC115312451 [Ixodes scapularis]|uniref:uncharacterized protein LOC115312451 n=1 Tax=Ixodes scapularis TaxID=6945 RepID=UPI001C38A21A|nr:uncharacterized protein LOC115312451 [Ixodes scapularis]